MEALLRDFRYAARSLGRTRLLAVAAVVCFGLGLGLVTTMFGMINALLLRPLPYPEADRLVAVGNTRVEQGVGFSSLSAADYFDFRAETRSFSGLALHSFSQPFNLAAGERPEYVDGATVSTNLFRTLRIRPALGRDFVEEEETPGRDRVALISDRLWERRFHRDPKAVGATVRLNGTAYTVVGVMPPGFRFPERQDVWVPLARDPARTGRGDRGYQVLGRLKPGLAPEAADADVRAVAGRLAALHPATNAGLSARVVSYHGLLIPAGVRTMLWVSLGAVGLVLLIACSNVANLLLARGAGRSREIAVRTALGASRAQIVRQLLAESVLLALVGGAAGVLLAMWGLELIRSAIPEDLPYWMRFDLDWRVLLFTFAASALTGVLFGLFPALQAARSGLQGSLRQGARGVVGGRGASRLRGALVAIELALSLVLLIGATLLIQSFLHLQGARLGFDPDRVLTARLMLGGGRYDPPAARIAFVDEVRRRAAVLPGVESVGVATYVPMSANYVTSGISVEGQPQPEGEEPSVDRTEVAGDYFRALSIQVLTGRTFTDPESADPAAGVVVVNQAMARRFWPGQSPLGRRLSLGAGDSWRTVVGVVGDVRQHAAGEPAAPHLYLPYGTGAARTVTLVVRSAADPASLAGAVQRVVSGVDPGIPTFDVWTMGQVVRRNDSLWMARLFGGMFSVSAAVALLLAAVGVYGVIAYSVAQRTHEIGVRMALGAGRRNILRLVIGQSLRSVWIGLGVGLPAAFGLTRVLSGTLHGVSATDPATFAGLSLALAGVALLASYLPARRATRVDPMTSLRAE